MGDLRENSEHLLTQKNKEERPERCREECKFVVINYDLFGLRIAMLI